MANNYTQVQIQKSILNTLLRRYNNIVNSVKLFGVPVNNSIGETTTLPSENYQAIFQQKIQYNTNDKTPYIITVKDLQKAVNYLENRFSGNCNCYAIQIRCQECQQQCTTDKGVDRGQCSCQYASERMNGFSYVCQTISCQTVNAIKSCENCQSCQSCQIMKHDVRCQSCQQIDCQTLRCEAPNAQCACQECQNQCSQCSCQNIVKYDSCQSQCK